MPASNDDMRDLYQDLILDHGKHPRNFRTLPAATHEALGHNPLCGDRLSLYLDVDDAGIIKDVAFQGSGCAISVASASMMSDMLKGKTVAQASHLFEAMQAACTGHEHDESDLDEDDRERIHALSGVRDYPVRVKCATLAWRTFQAALKNDKKASTE